MKAMQSGRGPSGLAMPHSTTLPRGMKRPFECRQVVECGCALPLSLRSPNYKNMTTPLRRSRQNNSMKRAFIIVAGALMLAVMPLRSADALTDALQKGLFEEEANQNLEGAIKAYQDVLSRADEQRRVAATALFRLAECYRKQGKTNEASAEYRRLVRDYTDQATLVNLSRQNLTGLGV